MADLIQYKKLVALDKDKHGKLKLKEVTDYRFVGATNSLPLLAVEFNEATKEYPIVFAKAGDGAYLPVALLGMREGENAFLSEDGRWVARYVPAFVRRYPFAPVEAGEGKMVLCVDEEAACLDSAQGETLFGEDGEPAALLQRVLAVQQEFHAQADRTQAFARKLADLNLLVESNAQGKLPDGTQLALSGIHVVDQNRLQVLDKEKVHELFASGELGLIYAHLLSLSNLQVVVERIGKQNAA